MGSSIFADESGDESARERRTADGRRSIFRQHDGEADGGETGDEESGGEEQGDGEGLRSSRDGEEVACDTDEGRRSGSGGDGSEDGTMTVFSGGEVFEVAVDDE